MKTRSWRAVDPKLEDTRREHRPSPTRTRSRRLGVLTFTDFPGLDYLPADVRPGFFRPASEPNDEATVRRIPSNLFLLLAALAGVASSACQSGGVGDPCIPEDEYKENFAGFKVTEENVESRSYQ